MTAKPRRYVRVKLLRQQAKWACDFCHLPGNYSGYTAGSVPAWTWTARDAHSHAAECPAVRAATERDRLAAELANERAETSHLRADRAAWRTQAIRAEAELIALREERA